MMGRQCGALNLVLCAVLLAPAPVAFASSKIPIPTPRPNPDIARTVEKQPTLRRTELVGTKLTLADAVFIGLRGNRAIKSAYIDRVAQKFDLRVAEDRFVPQFSIEGEIARQRIGNVTSTTIDASPGVTVRTRTGAIFDFAWNNSAFLGDGNRTFTSTAQVAFEQPLLRGAGAEVNTAPVEQARLGERVNRLRLRATISEVIGNIIFAHRDLLLSQEELQLAEDAVERGEELLAINQALIASGRLAVVDAVQTEADLENQKLRILQVKRRLETAQLALLNVLDLDLGSKVIAIESLTPRKIDTNISRLIGLAISERQDYQGQLYVIQQKRLGVTIAQNEQLWDIALFARGRLRGEFAGDERQKNIADVRGGLRFSFPINDLARQQQLVQADTGYRQAELQLVDIRAGIEMQIRSSTTEVNLLWQQIAVAERSHDLAARAVEIEKLKLNAGRSTTFQIRLLEDSLRSAENGLLAARIGYLNALTRLDLQLGTTLDTWKIALKD